MSHRGARDYPTHDRERSSADSRVESLGHAFCRRLTVAVPVDSVQQIDEAVALFDEAVFFSVKVYSPMKSNLTPYYHRLPEEVPIHALENNKLRRRWQRMRDPADKASFNREAGKLRRDLQVFR